MSIPAARSKFLVPAVAIALVALWCVALNEVSLHTWGFGALNFGLMFAMVGLVVGAKVWGRRVRDSALSVPVVIAASVVAAVVLGWFLYGQFSVFQANADKDLGSDIAANTYAADFFAFDLQQNPYTSHAQTGHRVDDAPNVARVNGQLEMFGVPYYYGYPYFPAMFFLYQPFRWGDSTPQAIRTGNGVYYFLLLAAMAWLAAILVPKGYRVLAALLSMLGFAATLALAGELFMFCTTDIVIPLFTLLGFIALKYGRHSLSGALIGWVFACKLVPGGLFVLLFLIWFWRRPERWKFLIPMFAVILAVIVPYVLKDPSAFLSATILYYLTEHAQGDSTALWFTLPAAIKPLFQIVGYSSVVALIGYAATRKSFGLPGALAICFVAGAVFVAFNRMAHLNYIWAIAPIGAVALVGGALGGTREASTAIG